MPSNKINLELPSEYDEIIVDICGNVDSGKSSLCGVLSHPLLRESMYNNDELITPDKCSETKQCDETKHCSETKQCDEIFAKDTATEILDNGKGSARSRVMLLEHEKTSGRTSSITYNYMIFDRYKPLPRIISLVDLAGHEQYLKTTITGVVSSYPEHGLVLVAKNITQMTREHYSILASMGIPVLFVLTKIDITPKKIIKENIDKIKIMSRRFGKNIMPITTVKEIHTCMNDNKIFGYIQISNKTGQGLALLISYIKNIHHNKNKNLIKGFAVSTVYDNITGFGLVVSGITGISISKGDSMFIGPFEKGEFMPVKIRSIHNDYRQFVNTLDTGVRGCLCIKFEGKHKPTIRMGMVITHDPTTLTVVKQFEADVAIFRGKSSNIKVGYNTYINIGAVRGAIKVTRIRDIKSGEDVEMLNTTKQAHMNLEFMQGENCINIGERFLFRAGRVCGIGKVTDTKSFNTSLLKIEN